MDGKQISKIRAMLGLGQSEFAQLFDVHPMTISKWERDTATPTSYQFGLLAEFEKAAKDKEIKKGISTLLITAGVIAVIYLLLSKSRGGKGSK